MPGCQGTAPHMQPCDPPRILFKSPTHHPRQVAGERQQHTQDLEAERARLMAEHTTADVQQAELHYAELATMTAAHEEQACGVGKAQR